MSGLEALGVTANAIAVVCLGGKVISWCYKYSKDLKTANDDIERVIQETKGLKAVAEDVEKLLEGPNGSRLETSQKLLAAAAQAHHGLAELESKLDQKKRSKIKRVLSLGRLRWPLESGDVERVIHDLGRCSQMIHQGLQVDQINIILEIDERTILERIPIAEGAAFDSHANEHEATCLPHTRVEVLQEISQWAESNQSKPIFWLNGSAGMGKSTIARTVARSLESTGHLGGTFFFKATDHDRSNLSKFVSTLTVDLFRRTPKVRGGIKKVLEAQGNDIFNKSTQNQWDQLILQPLAMSSDRLPKHPIVVVVEALDECKKDKDVELLIKLFTKIQDVSPSPSLRLFLTSRPELHIRLSFAKSDPGAVEVLTLHEVPTPVIKKDILIFLNFHLAEIRENYNASVQDSKLPLDWPGKEEINLLVNISSPLFSFAATICRFIGDHMYGHPDTQLQDLLRTGTKSQESQLDQTYLPVINRLVADRPKTQLETILQRFRLIVGSLILLETPLSKNTLGRLLGIDQNIINQLLDGLHSVLNIPRTGDSAISLFHLSFRDFLLDPGKAESPFWIDETLTQENLALRSLIIMERDLKENICGLENPGIHRGSIEATRISACVSPELQYSCSYWVRHLDISGTQIIDNGRVHEFLKMHFLHWLEACSLMGEAHICALEVTKLRLLTDQVHGRELLGFLHDAQYFITNNIDTINSEPLQLYSSLLAFTSTVNKVRIMFGVTVDRWVTVSTLVETDWDDCLQIMEGHTARVGHVVFSNDSRFIASSSDDGTIRIWNPITGYCVQTITGYNREWLTSPCFSHDSSFLLSGTLSARETPIQIWNIGTGERVMEMNYSDSEDLTALCHIPVCIQNRFDGAITICQSYTGKCLGQFETDQTRPSLFIFSSDLKLVAASSREGPVQILNTGLCNRIPSLHVPHGVNALAFSPDSKLLAVAGLRILKREPQLAVSSLAILDVRTSAHLITFKGNNHNITSIEFSQDSTLLVSGDGDGLVHLWRTSTGEYLHELKGHKGSVNSVSFSHDSTLVASASSDERVRVWRFALEDGQSIRSLSNKAAMGVMNRLDKFPFTKPAFFSPDLKLMATMDASEVRMWSVDTGRCLWSQACGAGTPSSPFLVFSPNSIFVCISTFGSQSVELLWANTGEPYLLSESHQSRIKQCVFSPDSTLIAFLPKANEALEIWSINTQKRINRIEYADCKYVTFSHDSVLVALCNTATISILCTMTGKCQQRIIINRPVRPFLSVDSKFLAAQKDGKTNVWRCDTGEVVQILSDQDHVPHNIIFVHDGRFLISSSLDCTIRIWDLQTGAKLHTLTHNSTCHSLSFDHSSSRLYTGCGAIELSNFSSTHLQGNIISSQRSGYGVTGSAPWITLNGRNFFYLPSEYWPHRAMVSGSTIVVSGKRGKTAIFTFSSSFEGVKPKANIRIVEHLNLLSSEMLLKA